MKINITIVPSKQINLTWGIVFNHLESYIFIQRLRRKNYVLALMNSTSDHKINSTDKITLGETYLIVSSDDYTNDSHIYSFYDKHYPSDLDELTRFDVNSRIKSLKTRANEWNKLKYTIDITAQVSCGIKATQWYFGYILALAKAFDGLIVVDEDADKIGKSETYGKNFNNIRFGIYTPEEFEAMVVSQNNQLT